MAQIVEEKKEKAGQKEKAPQPKTRKKAGGDKWKKKAWYTVIAPEEFERREIGETIAEKPEMLIGRVIAVTGRDLANQPKKQHIKIRFRVTGVSGNKALTQASGHIIKEDFIRRLLRRRCSKITSVKNYASKDAKKVKMKVIIVTEKRASGKQKAGIKRKSEEMSKAIIGSIDSRKVIDEIVFGTIPNKLYPELKKIVPIKRIEITSSSVF